MSRGEILTDLGGGLYEVKIDRGEKEWNKQYTFFTTRRDAFQGRADQLQPEIDELKFEYLAAKTRRDNLIRALKNAEPEEREGIEETIRKEQDDFFEKRARYEVLKDRQEEYLLIVSEAQKKLDYLDKNLGYRIREIWCAAPIEGLTGEVPIIDCGRETNIQVIHPGSYEYGKIDYSDIDTGRTVSRHLQSPEQLFTNLAIMPALQKRQPLYRVGKITDITSAGATVLLEPDYSSADLRRPQILTKNLSLETILEGVPARYGNRQLGAFRVDDEVVVFFPNGEWEDEENHIIGFTKFPRRAWNTLRVQPYYLSPNPTPDPDSVTEFRASDYPTGLEYLTTEKFWRNSNLYATYTDYAGLHNRGDQVDVLWKIGDRDWETTPNSPAYKLSLPDIYNETFGFCAPYAPDSQYGAYYQTHGRALNAQAYQIAFLPGWDYLDDWKGYHTHWLQKNEWLRDEGLYPILFSDLIYEPSDWGLDTAQEPAYNSGDRYEGDNRVLFPNEVTQVAIYVNGKLNETFAFITAHHNESAKVYTNPAYPQMPKTFFDEDYPLASEMTPDPSTSVPQVPILNDRPYDPLPGATPSECYFSYGFEGNGLVPDQKSLWLVEGIVQDPSNYIYPESGYLTAFDTPRSLVRRISDREEFKTFKLAQAPTWDSWEPRAVFEADKPTDAPAYGNLCQLKPA